MNHIIDYALWRGDLRFSQVPPCAVDFLVFSQLVHAPLERLAGAGEGQSLRELTCCVYPESPSKDENALIHSRYELWRAMETGDRFGGAVMERFLSHFEPEREKQFAGALFLLDDGSGVVAFRGTDATLVGWKEDFNMSFESPVPSQTEAVAFLEEAARRAGAIYLCGHSKGGNLALYASSMCSCKTREHIRGVYSFDGPGLDARTLQSEGYRAVSGRIHSYIPESSVIGLLMGYHETYTVVASDSVSLLQHNPYYWHVLGPAFITASDTTLSSQFANQTLHDFLDSCTTEQRRVLVDTLFSVLAASGATRLKDIPRGIATHLDEVRSALRAVPEEQRQVVQEVLRLLADAGGDNVRSLLQGLAGRLGIGGER